MSRHLSTVLHSNGLPTRSISFFENGILFGSSMLTPPLYKRRNGRQHVIFRPEQSWFGVSGAGLNSIRALSKSSSEKESAVS